MKTLLTSTARRTARARGFTLVELLVSSAVFVVAGGMLFLILNAGVNLVARNSSTNFAHQQLLKSIDRITRDVHGSVSIPQLVNSDRSTATGNGPAAGVTVQTYAMGPYQFTQSLVAPGNVAAKILTLATHSTSTSVRPAAGQHAVMMATLVEDDITAAAANSSDNTKTDITLANDVDTTVNGTNGKLYGNVPVLITNKISYVVVNGELRYFTSATSANYIVLSRLVSSTTPFSFTTNATNAASNRTLSCNLTVHDPAYSNRGFKNLDVSVNVQIPYRARLALFQ
jgi:prepilin-type N-terminal cleavage/methylation domain-containing protein